MTTISSTANHAATIPQRRDSAPSPALLQAFQQSRKALWIGRILTGLMAAFLLLDASMKLLHVPAAVEGTTSLGYPLSMLTPLGIVQLGCLALYLVPRTAPLGALLWTGYLGGAVATHVRAGDSLFGHVLFPIYVATLLWAGLWLRDRRVRGILGER